MTVKNIFKRFTDPSSTQDRYITIHGVPEGSSIPHALFGAPDIMIGTALAAAAAITAGTSGGLNDGINHAVNGAINIAMGSGIAWHFTNRAVQTISRRGINLENVVIDTQAKRPSVLMSAMEQSTIRRFRDYARILTLGASAFALLISAPSFARVAYDLTNWVRPDPFSVVNIIIPATMITRFAAGWVRANRLMNRRYGLTSKPN